MTAATIDERASALGVRADSTDWSMLNQCIRVGQTLRTSGHTSNTKGKVGEELSTADGAAAAQEAVIKLLGSVLKRHGTLEGLRVVHLLGCVNAAPDFTDVHLVINGASDVIRSLFGEDLGYHARSALGFATLPQGAAVEIEAVFEVVTTKGT